MSASGRAAAVQVAPFGKVLGLDAVDPTRDFSRHRLPAARAARILTSVLHSTRDDMSTAVLGSASVASAVQRFAPRVAWLARTNATAVEPLQVDLATLVVLLGGASDGCSPVDGRRFAVRRVARGATLVHEGAHADVIYAVQTGSFKIVKTAEDGYEHVLGQGWRGDVIGLDGLYGAHYAFAAVALEDSRAIALPLASLDGLRHSAPAFDAALQTLVSRQLRHIGEVAELMAAVAADVRLARFLVQLSARMAERGQSPHRLLLRMNRREIGRASCRERV